MRHRVTLTTRPHVLDATESTRQRIDRDIERYLHAIASLKSQRNTLAPISHLPPEIYSRIFAFAKTSSPAVCCPNSRRIDWIQISHVSVHWRNIALNTSALWDDPPLTNPRWTQLMLERSRSAKLSVQVDFADIDCPPRRALHGLTHALKHGCRIHHLAIQNVDSSCKQEVLEALPVHTPSLKTLRISGCRNYDHSDGNANGMSKQFCLPSSFLMGLGTNLGQLELAYCTVPGTCHLSRTITRLKLHEVTYTTNPTLKEFTRILSDLVHLETLEVKNTLPIPSTLLETTTEDKVHFSHLQRLSISSTIAGVAGFLHRFTFPSSTVVRIECGGSAEYIPAVFKGLTRSYTTPHDSLSFQTLVVKRGHDIVMDDTTSFSIQLSLLTEELPVLANQMDQDSDRLRLSFNDLWPNDKTKQLEMRRISKNKTMTQFFDSGFPLENISHVHLSDRLIIDPDTVLHTIGLLPQLRFVGASGHMGNIFIKALQLAHPKHYDNAEGIFFHSLSSLSLAGVRFSKYQGLNIDSLEDCLIQCYEHDAIKIKFLQFLCCQYLTWEEVIRFKQFIADVRS